MKNISIKLKFGVLIGILITIVVITISIVLLNQEKKVLIQRIKRQGILLSKNLASAAAEGITTSDELVIFQAIEDIMQEEGVLSAFVLDKQGRVIAHNDVKQVGKIYDTKKWNVHFKENISEIKPRLFNYKAETAYDFLYPVYVKTFKRGEIEEVLIGTAHIIFSYKIIINAIRKATITVFFISFIILILGIGASFLLTKFIVQPIMKIAKGAEEIGNGNLEYKISVNTRDELEFLARQFNIMTERLAEAQKIMLEQERLKYELDIATSIQNSLIPQKIPSIKGISISAYYKSAKEVGGDYYDFFKLDNNRLGFIIADVSGKGVPGAMVMVMVRSILRSQVYANKTAFHTLVNTNKLIYNDIREGMFVTAFYGIIDASQLLLQFVNAGHNPLIILRAGTDRCETFTEPGIPLGIQSPEVFEQALRGKFLKLQKGDLIIQYTDGITEARNSNKDEYGLKRLTEIVIKNRQVRSDILIKEIIKDVKIFCGDTPQHDDIAIIAIRV